MEINSILEYVLESRLQLVPFLWVIGAIVKNTEVISDRYIPVILALVGVAISISLDGLNPSSVIQGIMVTGVAVYGNELVKQRGRSD